MQHFSEMNFSLPKEIKSNFNHYLIDTFKSFVAKEIPGKKKKS